MSNNFDKNTMGNSPAALYIIDLLNGIERKKAVHLIKAYADFKETFKELLDAYDDGALSARVVRKYIETYRATLPLKREELMSKDYDNKIINLYENLVIAEFKKVVRKLDAMKRLEVSAISRAKSNLKKSGQMFNNEKVVTYGKYEGEEVTMEVNFNKHGLGSSNITRGAVEDKITAETLMEKSIKKIERRKLK